MQKQAKKKDIRLRACRNYAGDLRIFVPEANEACGAPFVHANAADVTLSAETSALIKLRDTGEIETAADFVPFRAL